MNDYADSDERGQSPQAKEQRANDESIADHYPASWFEAQEIAVGVSARCEARGGKPSRTTEGVPASGLSSTPTVFAKGNSDG